MHQGRIFNERVNVIFLENKNTVWFLLSRMRNNEWLKGEFTRNI